VETALAVVDGAKVNSAFVEDRPFRGREVGRAADRAQDVGIVDVCDGGAETAAASVGDEEHAIATNRDLAKG
jgi:hypothetical protein